jgi:hypothetical protein
LSSTLLRRGRHDAALDVIEEGFLTANRNSERLFEAELHRLKARRILAACQPDAANPARASLEQALMIARGQGALSLELRAACDLAALCLAQGEHTRALDVLAPVYSQFHLNRC